MTEKTQTAIEITLNGERMSIPPGSVADLLVALDLTAGKIAVERNLEIVPKGTYGTELLASGDRLEIVQFVGGG